MADENKGYGPWLKHPGDWAAHTREVQEVHRRMMEGLTIPKSLLDSSSSNYSSAAATAATYGPSVLKSAAEIMQALKDSGAANVVQDSRLRRGAYLVVPPDTLHQMKLGPMFTEVPEVEEGPIRFMPTFDFGVRMPIRTSVLFSTCGDIDSYEPPYKARPMPEPAEKAPAWQYVVAVAASVLILSMMFSAVGAL